MLYPGVAQPLTYQAYPPVGPAAAEGVPPTDAELVARLVPPLRGGYDPAAKAVGPPLTAREQTELDLATLESSYSAWIGGTGYARYRSGTVGFDRLTDFEASFEASVVAAKKARFTVVAKPVFLSNGVVDTATLLASTGIIPVLGTLPGNATVTPAQAIGEWSWRRAADVDSEPGCRGGVYAVRVPGVEYYGAIYVSAGRRTLQRVW